MKILLYGAGVIGSIYAAKLREAGNDVSILARGQRFQDLKDYGIVLEHALTRQQSTTHVNVIDQLSSDEAYDLIVVTMRKNHVAAALPILAANQCTPNVMFMVNNPSGYEDWINAVGRDRLLIGFPGAGGSLEGHVVRYMLTSRMQPTMMGEANGEVSDRLHTIGYIFNEAGFPVEFSHNMDAWQKCHVALVSPIADALYVAGGDSYRLSQMPETLRLMVRAMREGFRVLRALGVPIIPVKLRLWEWLPEPIIVAILKRWVRSRHFEIVAAHHANAARDEMQRLANEFQALAHQTSVETPAIDQLETYIDLAGPNNLEAVHA